MGKKYIVVLKFLHVRVKDIFSKFRAVCNLKWNIFLVVDAMEFFSFLTTSLWKIDLVVLWSTISHTQIFQVKIVASQFLYL